MDPQPNHTHYQHHQRHKGPGRQQKDRERAQAHHARLVAAAAEESTLSEKPASTAETVDLVAPNPAPAMPTDPVGTPQSASDDSTPPPPPLSLDAALPATCLPPSLDAAT